jgi:hypothetical protein
VAGVQAAELKAAEHAERAEAQRRRAEAKTQELDALRRQARALEQQSAALLAEAERGRRRVEEGVHAKEKIEQASCAARCAPQTRQWVASSTAASR